MRKKLPKEIVRQPSIYIDRVFQDQTKQTALFNAFACIAINLYKLVIKILSEVSQ